MKNQYTVAGFSFTIDAAEEALARMTNYEPFKVNDAQCTGHNAPLLFTLQAEAVDAIGEQEKEWQEVFTDTSDDDMPRIEVYRAGTDWILRESMYKTSPICLQIRATEDFSQAHLLYATNDARFALDNAAMLLYAFTTADKQLLEMHASVTVRGDRAYMFLGKSGTGKSTHSQQWMKAFDDAWLLNDDNPILRIENRDGEEQVWVYGSPWSGKTPCYKNDSRRVGGIVKLAQAPHNEIRPLRLPEAYAYMLSSSSGLKIEPKMMDALYETIAKTIQLVQVYGMECLPNPEAAEVCYAGML